MTRASWEMSRGGPPLALESSVGYWLPPPMHFPLVSWAGPVPPSAGESEVEKLRAVEEPGQRGLS